MRRNPGLARAGTMGAGSGMRVEGSWTDPAWVLERKPFAMHVPGFARGASLMCAACGVWPRASTK